MGTRLFRVVMPVSDIDRATAFYRAVLDQPGQRVSEGRHYFDCGGTILACVDQRADGDEGECPPNPEHVYFAVEDLEGVFERCQRSGPGLWTGSFTMIPQRKSDSDPGESGSFYVEDPFGNKLCFVDEKTTFTGG